MGKKRKNPYLSKDKDDNIHNNNNNNMSPPSSHYKRPRPSSSYHFTPQEPDDNNDDYSKPSLGVQLRLDLTYGQRGAFPGLDDDAEEEGGEGRLFYGPASDGLEYLRMVR